MTIIQFHSLVYIYYISSHIVCCIYNIVSDPLQNVTSITAGTPQESGRGCDESLDQWRIVFSTTGNRSLKHFRAKQL